MVATQSIRTILLAVGGAATLAMRARTVLLLLMASVCVLGLVRRLVSGGRIDNDPLLLIPVVLLALTLVKHRRDTHSGTASTPVIIVLMLVTLISLPVVTWAVVEPTVANLYATGLSGSCFVAILAARDGRLPDVRSAVLRAAPVVTALMAAYGILQFLVLPAWDRNWMIATRLESIGLPNPGQVRVFGTVESPGPFAIVLGGLILIVAHGLFLQRDQRKGLSIVALALALPAYFLTGVRTGLVSLALVLAVATLKTMRIKLLLFMIGGAIAIRTVGIAVLGSADAAASNVFTQARYSGSGLAQDQSLQQRLLLFDDLRPALKSGLGQGFGVARLDNMFVDAFVTSGVIVGCLTVVLVLTVAANSLTSNWNHPNAAFHLVTLYTVVFTLAAPIFATTSGLLIAICWGWALLRERELPQTAPSRAHACARRLAAN